MHYISNNKEGVIFMEDNSKKDLIFEEMDFDFEVISDDEMENIFSGKGYGFHNYLEMSASLAFAATGIASGLDCCYANTCTELGCC